MAAASTALKVSVAALSNAEKLEFKKMLIPHKMMRKPIARNIGASLRPETLFDKELRINCGKPLAIGLKDLAVYIVQHNLSL